LNKYEEARFALTPLTAEAEGRELLVPLSPALCVVRAGATTRRASGDYTTTSL